MKRNRIFTIGIVIFWFVGSAHAVSTQLTLVKEVIGGDATTTDWVLTADGTEGNDLSGSGWVSGTLAPDTFTLSESAGPPGYEAGTWDCVGGGSLAGSDLTLSAGEDVTCTIINTFVPPVVIFNSDFALPLMPVGDGAGTPVCIDGTGLLVEGCDVTITANEIDPTTVQKRVDGACSPGYLIRVINEDGSVVCEPDVDTDTTLTEGQVDAFVSNNNYSLNTHNHDADYFYRVTRAIYNGTTIDASPTVSFMYLRTIAAFSKISSTSDILIDWNSHVTVDGTGACNFRIHIDGSPGSGSYGAVVRGSVQQIPVSVRELFTGLSAGTHYVEIYDRGTSGTTGCTDNGGNYIRSVFVTEFENN